MTRKKTTSWKTWSWCWPSQPRCRGWVWSWETLKGPHYCRRPGAQNRKCLLTYWPFYFVWPCNLTSQDHGYSCRTYVCFLFYSFPTPRVDSVLEIYISSSQLVSGQAHAFWDVEMRAETNAITSLSKSPRQICFQMLSFGFSPSSCIYINLVFLFMQRSGCTWRNEYRSAGSQNGVDGEATHSGRIPILKLITEKGGNLNAKAKRGGILSSTVSRVFNSLNMSCCFWAATSKVARGIELDVCIQVLWYKL